MAGMTLRLLGTFEFAHAGKVIADFRTDKIRALISYLAVEADRPHRRTSLAGLLWSDMPEPTALRNLRKSLYRMHKTLDNHQPGLSAALLHISRQEIRLDSRDLDLDLDSFEQLLAKSEAHRHPDLSACPTCIANLVQAMELYRGEFMAGISLPDAFAFEEWQMLRRERLHQNVLKSLANLASALEKQGDYEAAHTFAARQVALEPWRESAHRQLMRLFAYRGQWAAAAAQYLTASRLLDNELGLAPAEETTALYQQILDRDLTIPIIDTLSVQNYPEILNSEESSSPVLFVTREPELDTLTLRLEMAARLQGNVIFIQGEAGAGKTTLMKEFARRAIVDDPALIVAEGNGYAIFGPGDPYLPFRDVLGMLTGDVEAKLAAKTISQDHARKLWELMPSAVRALLDMGPELLGVFVNLSSLLVRANASVNGRPNWLLQLERMSEKWETQPSTREQHRLFEQYTLFLQQLSKQGPLLLLLDDLQWADMGSTQLLYHLARRLAGYPILILAAYRRSEIVAAPSLPKVGLESAHPLIQVVNEFVRQFGDVQIDLNKINEANGLRFINARLDREPNRLDTGFRNAFFRQTKGHPLFTVELLQQLKDRGVIKRDTEGAWIQAEPLDWHKVPERVETVIAQRIDQLDEDLSETLRVASVEGEVFTAQVISHVRGVPERTILRQLYKESEKSHGLIRDHGNFVVGSQQLAQFRFSHFLYLQYLNQRLGSGERRIFHGEIARFLDELYLDASDQMAAQLARHYAEAGIIDKAIEYLLKAGDVARASYAHEQASQHYHQALAYLKQAGDYQLAARTSMKLGLTYQIGFGFLEAGKAFEEGFALWRLANRIRPATPGPPAPHRFRVDWLEPPTLDPTQAGNFFSAGVIGQLFSGLVELSPELEILPDMAADWDVRDGGLRYRFRLRQDIAWSDGQPVKAADFEYAWKRVLSAPDTSLASLFLSELKGARYFHQGSNRDPRKVGVKAIDDTILEVALEVPSSYFLHVLAHPAMFPIPQHVVELHGENWTKVDRLVSNGPFQLISWKPGHSLLYERNPGYPGPFSGNLTNVEMKLQPDPREKLALYEADRLDIHRIWLLPAESFHPIRQRHASEYLLSPQLLTLFASFDLTREPFKDPRIRKAFALSVDKEQMANVLGYGVHVPATGGLVPPGMPGHSSTIGLEYDPDQARRLLAAAGFADGHDFPEIHILASDYRAGEVRDLVTIWRENLSVEIKVVTIEQELTREILTEKRPRLFYFGWTADYPDPDNFLRVCVSWIIPAWQQEKYWGYVRQARQVMDQETRIRLYQKADQVLVQDAAILPLMYGRAHMLIKPWVKKYPLSVMRGRYWKDVMIEPH